MARNFVPIRVGGLLIAGAAVLAGPGSHAAVQAGPGNHGRASCWHTVPGPTLAASHDGDLIGVSMTGPDSGWAVGYTDNNQHQSFFHPLLADWNGRRWQVARPPAGANGPGKLDGIAALSASNAWAVGYAGTNSREAPLILHWDGRQWARVPAAPVPGWPVTELLSVAAASPSDAWAVGEAETLHSQTRPVTEHWNGRTWALVPSPSLGTLSSLNSVAVASNHQAWAVGGSFAPISHPFVLAWNGHTWQRAATPVAANIDLSSVAAVSPSQVWAVGFNSADGPEAPYTLRWNGHVWRSVPVPFSPGRIGAQLGSVTAVPGGHLAAAGDNLDSNGALYAQWNGHRWAVTDGPPNGTSPAAITTDGHTLWTVGTKDLSTGPTTPFVPVVQTCQR